MPNVRQSMIDHKSPSSSLTLGPVPGPGRSSLSGLCAQRALFAPGLGRVSPRTAGARPPAAVRV